MPLSSSFIKLLDKVEPELRDVFLAFFDEIEKQRTVTKEEFNELKVIVKDLGENLNRLAEAQRRTEERLNQLAERVDKLAEAQKRTEESLESFKKVMEENFNRVWEAIGKLVEAQRKTEERLALLVKEFKDMRKQFGDLSDSVGYGLEDKACRALPGLLERDYGVRVDEKLVQEFVFDPGSGRYIEVNIFGKGKRDGESVVIVGEAKSRLSKNKVNEFLKDKVNKISKIYGNVFPVLVIYVRREPDAVEYAKSKGVAVYYSRELE